MLCLRRSEGTEIVIGNEIRLKFCDIKKGTVAVLIDAPKDVPIWRGEIQDKIDAEQQQPAAAPV